MNWLEMIQTSGTIQIIEEMGWYMNRTKNKKIQEKDVAIKEMIFSPKLE
jgi:hypothetical protein